MRHHRTTAALTGLLLISLAGAADAGDRQGRSPHHQTRGMIERLHDGGGHHARGHGHERSRHNDNHGGNEWQRSRHGRGHQHHDGHNSHDRDLHWGHERWRESTDGRRHSLHGRGYWNDYHNAYRHHRHDYRHRFYNNYHYYYNASGFYFPEYGFISRGHTHGRHCPHWHFEDFAAGFVLGAIIID